MAKELGVSLQNIEIFDNIIELLQLKNSNKTKNPNKLSELNINNEQMISLIIGFIDGDGSINNKGIRIKIDLTWLENLKYIEKFIYQYLNIPHDNILTKINNQGYSLLQMGKKDIRVGLKEVVEKLKLPVLKRKWAKIN